MKWEYMGVGEQCSFIIFEKHKAHNVSFIHFSYGTITVNKTFSTMVQD